MTFPFISDARSQASLLLQAATRSGAAASGLIPGPGNKGTLIPSPLGDGSEFRVTSSCDPPTR